MGLSAPFARLSVAPLWRTVGISTWAGWVQLLVRSSAGLSGGAGVGLPLGVVRGWQKSLDWRPLLVRLVGLTGSCGGLAQVTVDHRSAGMVLHGLSITRLDQPSSLGGSPWRCLDLSHGVWRCPVRRISGLARVVWPYSEVSCRRARAHPNRGVTGVRRSPCHDGVADTRGSRSVAGRVRSAAFLPPDG